MTRPYTPEELLELILPHLDQRKKRERVTKDGKQVQVRCPFHNDNKPSLSLTIENGKLLANCFVCGKVYDRLLKLAGIDSATARPIAPRAGGRTQRQPAPSQTQPLTLAVLANAKGLDAEQLIAWHVRELPDGGIEILYLTREGELHAVRYRLALEGANRFRWRQGDTPILYGLWRLPEWGDADTLYLCEGESDTWSLWHAGLAALGIPGASMWKPEWWREVEAFERIVLIADADQAGATLVEKLALSCPDHLRGRVYVLRLPEGVKDANELWQRVDADPERFKEALAKCEICSLARLHDCTIARIDSEDDLTLLAPLGELLASNAERVLEYVPLLGVDGLIARGVITLIGAHPKAGKTTLLVHACREWVRRGLRVVYLSEEPHAVWRERVKRFPELGKLIVNTIPRAHPEHWARAIRELQEEPDIVIVDTIRRFLPAKDENDSALVSAALAPFVDLTRHLPRTAIVLVHHTKKNLNEDGEITDIAGSLAYTAEVDMVFRLAPVREHKRQRVLTPIAGRLWSLSPEPLVLELSEDASEYRVLGTAEEVLPETLAQSTKEKILHALHGLGYATVDEIAEYLQERGEHIPKRTIHHHLAQLHAEGAVNREGRGTRAEPYTYSCNRAIVQSCNDTPEPLQSDAATLFTLAAERGFPALVVEYPDDRARFYIAAGRAGWELALPELERENLLQSAYHALVEPSNAPTAEPPPAMPDLFTNRTPLVWDLIDDWLHGAPIRTPADADAVLLMLAYAEARGFPALVVDGYRIHGDMAGWLTAAQQLAGTPAIARATRMLHALDGAGDPATPTTHNTMLRNGDAGLTPSQLSFEEA